ncbi:hypothetical protein Tco_0431105 [Tanacetum coccineum]
MYSTGQIPPKKSRGKGSQGKKSTDPTEESVDMYIDANLGKSISLTKSWKKMANKAQGHFKLSLSRENRGRDIMKLLRIARENVRETAWTLPKRTMSIFDIIHIFYVPSDLCSSGFDKVKKKQESEKSQEEIIIIKREQEENNQEPTYTIKSSDQAALEEFDLKSALFKSMHKNKSANRNTARYYRLYPAS